MNKPYITNIQKYSIHDGEGIRTTVFFKGCPLSCLWCHNPETQRFTPEVLVDPAACAGCGECARICPEQAVRMEGPRPVTDSGACTGCEECLDYCLKNARVVSGKTYPVEELMKELEKDRAFYEQSGGGVTLSGGEVLAQDMDYVENLAKMVKERGMTLTIDTCGAVPFSRIERIVPWTDVFLYDIKLLDSQKAMRYLGSDGRLALENLKKFSDFLAKQSQNPARIWIRLPIIGGVNDTKEHIEAVADFLLKKKIRFERISLLPYHNTGSGKYNRLGRRYEGEEYYVPDHGWLEEMADYLKTKGLSPVKIGG